MIPKNISKEDVLSAINKIDKDGIPKNRLSVTYNISYKGKVYPPKYVLSLANYFANGEELSPSDFGGGEETNSFLRNLGFTVLPNKPQTSSTVTYSEKGNTNLIVTTATLESESDFAYYSSLKILNAERTTLLREVISNIKDSDIILFPAGFFELKSYDRNSIRNICNSISHILAETKRDCIVCAGIDCNEGDDQLCVAVSKDRVLAVGRKFYPTPAEKGFINEAVNFNETEMGHNRFFCVKGYRTYMAVCYDCFGLRHKEIPNEGFDLILTLAHRFHARGEGPSGDVDFARKGFAGASSHWNCPVFGTAVFFDRPVPPNWPTGVLWKSTNGSVKSFRYSDNTIKPDNTFKTKSTYETAICYKYTLPPKSEE